MSSMNRQNPEDMKIEVWEEEEEDPYASIVNIGPQTASLEQEIDNCPFLRAPDMSDSSSAARISSYPDSTFSDDNGIVMLSLPDSFCSVPEVEEEEALFHTPTEHSSLLQLSSSEDQILDEVCVEDARHFDLGSSKRVRSREGGLNDEPLTKKSMVEEEEIGAGMVYGGRAEAASIEMKKSNEQVLDVVVVGSLKSELNAEVGTIEMLESNSELMSGNVDEIDVIDEGLELINSCDIFQDRDLDENVGVIEIRESTVARDEVEGDQPIEYGEKDILDEDIALMEISESTVDGGAEDSVEYGEKDAIGENNGFMETHGFTVDGGKGSFEYKEKEMRNSAVTECKRSLEDILKEESIWLREMHESTVDGGANKGNRPLDIVSGVSRKNYKSINKAEKKKGLGDSLDVLKDLFCGIDDDDDDAFLDNATRLGIPISPSWPRRNKWE